MATSAAKRLDRSPYVTVYTCNVNDYDFVLRPLTDDPNLRFVYFTDRPTKRVRGWDTRPVQSPSNLTDSTLINRYHKFFPHKLGFDTDWSVYIDGNMRVLGPISRLVADVQRAGATVACLEHPTRGTVDQEILACKEQGKIRDEEIPYALGQFQRYCDQGMPADAQLLENKVIIRDHASETVQQAMATWWRELTENVRRDQISLPYVLWKHGVTFTTLPAASWQNLEFFQRYDHRRRGLAGIRQRVSLWRDYRGMRHVFRALDFFRRLFR